MRSDDINRLCIKLFAASSLVVFTVVPTVVSAVGLEHRIYPRGGVQLETLLFNALAIVVSIGVGYAFIRRGPKKSGANAYYPFTKVVSLALIVWAAVFWFSGGATFRESDVYYGIGNRSAILGICFSLLGACMIGTSYLYLSVLQCRHGGKWYVVGAISLFAITLALSGSRGYFINVILILLSARYINDGSGAHEGHRGRPKVMSLRSLLVAVKKGIYYMTGAALIVVLFAAWGAIRDQYDSSIFSFLFRLSDPYWHYAVVMTNSYGADPSIYWDSVQRLASIPGRFVGMEFQGSIDGAEYYLKRYLGISYVEGVSLPVTLLGHGYLAMGYLGVGINYMLTVLLIGTINIILVRVSSISPGLVSAIMSYQITKMIVLYPKSLSGIFVSLAYELLRDVAIVVAVALVLTVIHTRRNEYDI